MIAVNKMKMISHARTVVQECCKGDDESQWERGKFDPCTQKPLNRWSPKFVYVTTWGYLQPCKILSKSAEGFRFCACVISRPSAQSDLAIFWGVLEKGYSRDARSDFDAKYVNRRGSTQGSAQAFPQSLIKYILAFPFNP